MDGPVCLDRAGREVGLGYRPSKVGGIMLVHCLSIAMDATGKL